MDGMERVQRQNRDKRLDIVCGSQCKKNTKGSLSKSVPTWLWIVSTILAFLLALNYSSFLIGIMALFICVVCAWVNWRMAYEIESNQYIAWFIGIVCGLYGFGAYLIYYFIKRRLRRR